MYKIMTPGPTQVPETVRRARSFACTNPDLDEEFYDFYKETCELISSLLGTKNETLILDGEGILGLEAACASLTEPGSTVKDLPTLSACTAASRNFTMPITRTLWMWTHSRNT